MCKSRNSVKIVVYLDDFKKKARFVKVDKCMANLIRTLNSSEHISRTLACCCGHGKYPMTIIVNSFGNTYELISGKAIFRKRNFYRKNKNGYYYIPETVRGFTSATPTSNEGMELPLNPIPSTNDIKESSGTKPLNEGI